MSTARVHHRFSVDDYEQMIARSIITENDRVELIRGEVLEKMGIGDQHAACVKRLNRLLAVVVGSQALLSIQDPVRLGDSEPEPDVALLSPRADYYASGKPTPADVLLLIEVADSTVDFDRDVKGPLYAEAGITEYWLINLVDRCIEAYRGPQADGQYADVRKLRHGETLEIAALPGCVLAVDQIM